VENLHDKELSLMTHLLALRVFSGIEIKPAIKLISVCEYVRHHKVEKSPELFNIILERSACQQ